MKELKTLTYPSGVKLIRTAKSNIEVWVLDNNIFAKTVFRIDIVSRESEETIIMDEDKDISDKEVSKSSLITL